MGSAEQPHAPLSPGLRDLWKPRRSGARGGDASTRSRPATSSPSGAGGNNDAPRRTKTR
jgi:hypothetical protein